MDDIEWLMLNFTLPKEPSRLRVSVWRKLKKHGSVCIGQSMWLLPISDENIGFFNDVSAEILQNKGTAYVLKSSFIRYDINQISIVELFNRARDVEYGEFLEKCEDFFEEIKKETESKNFTFAELEENEDEYHKLEDWLVKISRRDFFNAQLKKQSQDKLDECKEMFNDFSEIIYGTNNEIR